MFRHIITVYLLCIYLKHRNKVFFYHYNNCLIERVTQYFVRVRLSLRVTQYSVTGKIYTVVSTAKHIQYK